MNESTPTVSEAGGTNKDKLKFSVITPCKNAEADIRQTVASVLNQTAVQNGRVELEYYICDGNSSDRTLEIIQSFQSDHIRIHQQEDASMYEALAKGLQLVSGDVIAYINAGDLYFSSAFDVVADIFLENSVGWLTGFNVGLNMKSQVISCNLPYKYREEFFAVGTYDGRRLPFVEQESTFWKKSLMDSVDPVLLSSFKYAGDFYLWHCFSREEDLYIVQSFLGSWRRQRGQLSENMESYLDELTQLTRSATIQERFLVYIDRCLWYAPNVVKRYFNKDRIFHYDIRTDRWSLG